MQNSRLAGAISSKDYTVDGTNNVQCTAGAVCGVNVPPASGEPFHFVAFVRGGRSAVIELKVGDAALQNNCNPTDAPTPMPTPLPTV